MPSRRAFLNKVAAGLGASALGPRGLAAQDTPEIKTALNGPVGLQLYSLREYLPKDVPGTLAKVRAMGFREVEAAGLWGQTATEHRAALDKAGLRCPSAHMSYERLRDDLKGAFAEIKTLGAKWVVCPWIPHEKNATASSSCRRPRARCSTRWPGLRIPKTSSSRSTCSTPRTAEAIPPR
jgi:hypothetical protein